MARLPIGHRIREARRDRGLTQSGLAETVGISASYLNLIEHDKRAIGGALLKRLAETLSVDLGRLSGSSDAQLAHEVADLARSMGLAALDDRSAARFVAQNPAWAQAFKLLHRAYVDAQDTAAALSDRLSQDPALMELSHAVLTKITAIRSFAEILEGTPDLDDADRARFSSIIATQSDQLGSSAQAMIGLLDAAADTPRPATPGNEVDDFIIYHGNHFPELEDAAEGLRRLLRKEEDTLSAAIVHRLTRLHGVRILVHGEGRDVLSDQPAAEAGREALVLDEWAQGTTARFQQALRLVEHEMDDLFAGLLDDPRLTTDEARRIARRALANYACSALLFPYDRFLEAAERDRYDIDRLGARFGGSFEQIAHRLVTLRRPGAEGVPFAFLRADPAGNTSKPFSVPGLRMPRLGGACPLWAIYGAFASPDRTVAQLAAMPHGETYLFIARRRTKHLAAFGTVPTTYAIMLGCHASYGDRIVYGDGFAAGRDSQVTPVGFNCRSCGRTACAQRAQPAILAPQT
ncbi:MAG: DUF2083 domain-containing protein [Rhodobacterales bacterium]|nr:DUF2083 domain-containing protein [Rhodobacterales bacterium]